MKGAKMNKLPNIISLQYIIHGAHFFEGVTVALLSRILIFCDESYSVLQNLTTPPSKKKIKNKKMNKEVICNGSCILFYDILG